MATRTFNIAFTPLERETSFTEDGLIVSGYAITNEIGETTKVVIDCRALPGGGQTPFQAVSATFDSTDKTVTVNFGG